MIGEHEPAHAMCGLNVWGLPRQRNLDRRWTPGNKLRQLPLSDSLQTLVHLRRVHFALYDVQNGDIAVTLHAVHWRGNHHVLGLKEASHHVQHGCFSHIRSLNQVVTS